MHKILRNNYNFIISSKWISVLTFISNIKSTGIYKFNMLNNRFRFNYLFYIFAYFFSFLCHTRSNIIYVRAFRTKYVTLTYTNASGLTNLLSFKTHRHDVIGRILRASGFSLYTLPRRRGYPVPSWILFALPADDAAVTAVTSIVYIARTHESPRNGRP